MSPSPITLVRKRIHDTGQQHLFMQGCLDLVDVVLPHSRRAARLLERLGLERPGMRLSTLLADLSQPQSVGRSRGIPVALVDKLGEALLRAVDRTPARPLHIPTPAVMRLRTRVLALRDAIKASAPQARPEATLGRLTLESDPPALFFALGRGLDAVPAGLSMRLPADEKRPLELVPVRSAAVDAPTLLYAIERILDVVEEPVADEGERLAAMLSMQALVRVARLDGGGVRIALPDGVDPADLGLQAGDRERDGRYVVHAPLRARALLAQLALRDDVAVAWAGPPVVLRRADARALRVTLPHGNGWLEMSPAYALDADGIAVEAQQLQDALREGRRYVMVGNDTLVALHDDALEAVAALALSRGAVGVAAAHALGAQVDGAGWSSLKADLDRVGALTGDPLPTLHATLRPYQREGLRFLRRLAGMQTGGVLADDMGLGKTVMSTAFLLDRADLGPQLVVAPTSVCTQWERELGTFAPTLRVVRFDGPARARVLAESALGPQTVVVTSYAVLQRDALKLKEIAFATALFDEAQQVKTATTKSHKAAKGLNASVRIALTGTPLENHTGELWAIFDVVAPGLFGSWTAFKARFASPIEKDGDVLRRKSLARALRPFVLRRKKADVAIDLPPRTDVVRLLPLEKDELHAYERLRTALLATLEDEDADPGQARMQVLAALTTLRLAACHKALGEHVLLEPSAVPLGSKQRALLDLLTEAKAAGVHALVFSQFVKHLDLCEHAAQTAGFTTLRLDGSTPQAVRQERIDAFQAGSADAFFISLKAGGTGLNLTRASTVVHMDPWWNPAAMEQATGRAHRIGQNLPVTVVRLVAEGTVEEAMLALHDKKHALVEGVLEGTAAAATLDVDALKALFATTRRYAGAPDAGTEVQEAADPP